ncbi:hypothetical protein DYB95_07025 [Vibrio cholerae]|nr:hypothetical protein [Vibrio cholerae]BCK23882.1 hypothetical protein VCSRO63_0717 [Vibrio cholerae]
MDSCKCFEKTLEEMKAKAMEKLPEGATDVSVTWDNYSYFFTGDYVPVNPTIRLSYRGVKKDKTPAKNLTKEFVNILCSYCPFCGRKVEK